MGVGPCDNGTFPSTEEDSGDFEGSAGIDVDSPTGVSSLRDVELDVTVRCLAASMRHQG